MTISITVRGLKGTRLRLDVPLNMLVGELLAKMEKVHGYAAAVGSLIFAGEIQDEEKCLGECGMENGSIVWFIVGKKHLALRSAADDLDPVYQRTISVVLREDNKGTTWFFRLSPASTVGHLKKLVKGAIRVPEDSQTLVFMGRVLCDPAATLSQINYIPDYVIQLWVDGHKLKPIFNRSLAPSSSGELSPATNALLRKQLFGGRRKSFVEPLVQECVPAKVDHPLAGADIANSRPDLMSDGLGGTYLLYDASREPLAVFKPHDEEPQAPRNPRGLCGRLGGPALKRGVRAGEGALREYIAYLLDHDHAAGVPHTSLVYINWDQLGREVTEPTPLVQVVNTFNDGNRMLHSVPSNEQSWKMGSVQAWQPNIGYAEDFGFTNFDQVNVQNIAVHDIRLANLDRHSGNLLAVRSTSNAGKQYVRLVPIDHGYSLPEYTDLEDISFEWLLWPQVQGAICREVRNRIAAINIEEECKLLRRLGLRGECVVTHVMTSTLLKKAAARGFSLHDIGEMMVRSSLSQQSVLELLRDRAMKKAKMMCRGKKTDIAGMEELMCAVFDEVVNLHLAEHDKERRPRSLSVVVASEIPHLGSLSHHTIVDSVAAGTSLTANRNDSEDSLRTVSSPGNSPNVHSQWSSDSSGLWRRGSDIQSPSSKSIVAPTRLDDFKLNVAVPAGFSIRSPMPIARRSLSWGGSPRDADVQYAISGWHPCSFRHQAPFLGH